MLLRQGLFSGVVPSPLLPRVEEAKKPLSSQITPPLRITPFLASGGADDHAALTHLCRPAETEPSLRVTPYVHILKNRSKQRFIPGFRMKGEKTAISSTMFPLATLNTLFRTAVHNGLPHLFTLKPRCIQEKF